MEDVNNVVIGGAGFIGSRLVNRLRALAEPVTVIDDFRNFEEFGYSDKFFDSNVSMIQINFSTVDAVKRVAAELDNMSNSRIWHMAANSDIHRGMANPFAEYQDTLGTTVAAIELSKLIGCKEFVFASTSAIYGEPHGRIFSETQVEFSPISNYGVMKLSSENLIRVAFLDNQTKVRIYRFPNVIGYPSTHGVLHDLTIKLGDQTTSTVDVLGDGSQQKPFIHVDDLVQGMLVLNSTEKNFDVFNIGPNDEGVTIRELAEMLRDALAPKKQLSFGVTHRGWIGDVPKYNFDTTKSMESGFIQTNSSHHAVRRVISEILDDYEN